MATTTTPTTLEDALEALAEANTRIHDLEDAQLFTSGLRLLERGILDRQLGEELGELSDAVLAQQKKGSITVKLDVAIDDADEDRLAITADYSVRKPKLPRKASKIFRDRNGGLTRNYPRQITSAALGGEED